MMRRMFSEKQIKRMIAESSDEVVESLVGQDVKVKTIEQSEFNYSVDLTPTLSQTLIDAGITIENSYTKIVVANKILYIVAAITLKNNTESNVTITGGQAILNFSTLLDEKYGSKIFDAEGKALNETTGSFTFIDIDYRGGYIGRGVGYMETQMITNHSAKNTISANIQLKSSQGIQANSFGYVVSRTFFVLE